MKISEQELNLIQSLLVNKPCARELNKTLKKLNEEFGIGKIFSKEIHFDEQCFRDLEDLYSKYAKCSYWQKRPKDIDRFEKAKVSLSEKAGGRSVFASQLQFASMSAPLPLIDQADATFLGYNGMTFLIDKKHVDVKRIQKLVVVENGIMLPHLHEWFYILPDDWKDALFLYRGHESNAKSVMDLVKELSENAQCAVFTDFDLGGLVIIQSYANIRPVYCLIPQHWESITRNHECNLEDVFVEQYKIATKVNKGTRLQLYKEHILKNRLALMQENVLAFKALRCEPVTL